MVSVANGKRIGVLESALVVLFFACPQGGNLRPHRPPPRQQPLRPPPRRPNPPSREATPHWRQAAERLDIFLDLQSKVPKVMDQNAHAIFLDL